MKLSIYFTVVQNLTTLLSGRVVSDPTENEALARLPKIASTNAIK